MKPAPFTRCECDTTRAASEARQARAANLRAARVAERSTADFSRDLTAKLRTLSPFERVPYSPTPNGRRLRRGA